MDVALTETGPVEEAWLAEDTDPVAEALPNPPLAPLYVAR